MPFPNPAFRAHGLGLNLIAAACVLAGGASAQTMPAPPAAPVPAPDDAAPQRVEVTGERSGGEMQERRQSTVARTVIGREEIERFGDASLGEVLKRLPGVTLDGAPGRGGNPRLRGLGGGYTQLLLDGERVPPGFEIDSIAPEQIERIEILRAPTAETGARAVAGTINIITRESFRRRLNDLRLSLGLENGRWSPGLNWTRSGSDGALSYTFGANAVQTRFNTHSVSTLEQDVAGVPTLRRQETTDGATERRRLTLNGRLQWKLGEGEAFTLTPFAILSGSDSRRFSSLLQDPAATAPYTQLDGRGEADFNLLRLSAQRTQRLGDGTRLEWRAGAGRWRYEDEVQRFKRNASAPLPGESDQATITDQSWNASVKASTLLADAHSGVAGLELEGARREELRSYVFSDGTPRFPGYGTGLQARSQRVAVYAQDEWEINRHWAAHAGLRWESIETRGEGLGGGQRNRSAVWSPLLHAVWKPDPKRRDQLRMSLTRSYRAPPLNSLVGRPLLSVNNSATSPDRAGNPALRPELATGLDLTFERYLPGGGLLSAGVFHRRISDLVRYETLPPAPGERWVNRPYNVGEATVQGLELEAKVALRELMARAPAVDLRASANFFRSRVESVPGPDNRVEQQPGMTANLGADWTPRALPLKVGANLHWTSGYVTRLSPTETAVQGRKPVFDAYALWTVSPTLGVRLSASNFTSPDYVRGGVYDDGTLYESSRTVSRSYVDWMLRVEMKL